MWRTRPTRWLGWTYANQSFLLSSAKCGLKASGGAVPDTTGVYRRHIIKITWIISKESNKYKDTAISAYQNFKALVWELTILINQWCETFSYGSWIHFHYERKNPIHSSWCALSKVGVPTILMSSPSYVCTRAKHMKPTEKKIISSLSLMWSCPLWLFCRGFLRIWVWSYSLNDPFRFIRLHMGINLLVLYRLNDNTRLLDNLKI
jgi:hypothetical protein